LTIIFTLSTPKKSEAVIGAMAPSAGFTLLAYATIGGSVLTGIHVGEEQARRDQFLLGVILGTAIGAAGSYVGLIFLDEQQEVKFSYMDSKAANKLGVTESERQAFNDELEEANLVFEDIKQNPEGLSPLEV
jgi:hypothetical protein